MSVMLKRAAKVALAFLLAGIVGEAVGLVVLVATLALSYALGVAYESALYWAYGVKAIVQMAAVAFVFVGATARLSR